MRVYEAHMRVYDSIQLNTTQYNSIQLNTIQYNSIQYNTIQYNIIQYNTAFAVCKTHLPNFAQNLWSDLDSENCSEITAVTQLGLQIAEKDLKSRHGDISNLPLLSVKHVCLISQKTYGPILIPKTVLKSVL